MTTQEFIPNDGQVIAAYSKFEAQLATLEKESGTVVFDYATAKGEKAARSHIHKLRMTKGAVDRARKGEKQAALDYGRSVDTQAKEITSRIEAMIEVHQKPLDEIKAIEAARIAEIEGRIAFIEATTADLPNSSALLRGRLASIEQLTIDESFQEFMAIATAAKAKALSEIKAALDAAIAREAQAAELEALREEKEARERQEREEKLKEEAAREAREAGERKAAEEAARREAEHEAKLRETEEGARRDAEAAECKAAEEAAQREAEHQAELREKEEAREEMEREAAEVKAIADQEQRDREAAEREAQAKEADANHRGKIEREAIDGLTACGQPDAQRVIELIVHGKVPHVSITYQEDLKNE